MAQHRVVGLSVIILGIVLLFVLIPTGVDAPNDLDHITTSPQFWPRIISVIFSLMGVLIFFKPEVSLSEQGEEFGNWSSRLPRLAIVLAAFFTFYFLIGSLGMVVPGIAIIFAMMWFAGERRWLWMAGLSVGVPLLLYFFFVHVANIPIPLGIFEVLRG